MKSIRPTYITLFQNNIIFPKEVVYLDDGYYLCKGPLNEKYVIGEESITKLDKQDFINLIDAIHRSIYSQKVMIIEFRNITDDAPFRFYIYPNGNIRCRDCSSTLFVPNGCMRWDYCVIQGYFPDSYELLPCDKKGYVIEKSKTNVNAYNNNCNIVFNMIADNPGINTSQLIEKLGWPPNSVTSRISDLTKGGRIYSIGRETNPKSGRKVHKWMTTEDVEGACYVL